MPLSFPEILSDTPAALELVNDVQTRIAAAPPAPERKAVDYAKILGADPAGPLFKLAELVDTVEAQSKS